MINQCNFGMGLLDRIFGKKTTENYDLKDKHICPKCGFDLNTVHFHVTGPISAINCPKCGFEISKQLSFTDIRSIEEKQIEKKAQQPLDRYEELAHRLFRLQNQRDEKGYLLTEARKEIRTIGEKLCAKGGNTLMLKVAYRVGAIGGDTRILEIVWEGLCGWRA